MAANSPSTFFRFLSRKVNYLLLRRLFVCKGSPLENGEDYKERLDDYLEWIELEGEANPRFLNELHFKGTTVYEWEYQGKRLSEAVVLQIIKLLQDDQPAYISSETPDVALAFTYDRFHVRKDIKLLEDDGRFLVFINGQCCAEPITTIKRIVKKLVQWLPCSRVQ